MRRCCDAKGFAVTHEGPQAEAVIDLTAYRQNLRNIAQSAPTAELMAVVKADAYGHGMDPCARAAREAGAHWLGVATLAEARALRTMGDTGKILCWLAAPGADFAGAVDHDIEVTASSAEQLAEITACGSSQRPKVQLKVDTGLSRNGAYGQQWELLLAAAARSQAAGVIEVTGVWSHLACADEPGHKANADQERVFREAIEAMINHGLQPGLRHLANSAAALTRPSAHFDLVRVGIASYGINPAKGMLHNVKLTPVMTLRARLAAVKRVRAKTGVSYGHTFITERETTLGLVPMGYAEGIFRRSANIAEVQYAAVRAPLVGVVCMDQFVVDLGDQPARRGDIVTLFGSGEDGEPLAEDWAEAVDTIAYEIVTKLGGRIERTYLGE